MLSIETTAVISSEGLLELKVPRTVKPGKHKVIIVIDENEASESRDIKLPEHDVGPWPSSLSLRREDMYGDDE